MSVSVISKNSLCKDAIVRACHDHNLEVRSQHDRCADFDENALGDVLLWHLSADDPAPIDSINALHVSHPDLRIVVLATRGMCGTLETECGNALTAVIHETTTVEGLIGVLQLAEQGYSIKRAATTCLPKPSGRSIGPVQVNPVAASAASVGATDRKCPLSERESAVLAFLRAGYSNKSIARELGICDATVKAHLRSSFRRIGATNRTQAAVWAAQNL